MSHVAVLTVVGAKCKVSFDVPNSLGSVLGFKQDIVCGRHASEKLVNIMSVNSILVHCNIIHSSYMRGQQARVVYNFFPNVSYTGGFIGMLASLAARAIPLVARALPTILWGLTTGLLSGGINKAISGKGVGDGLYLHIHDKCYRVQKMKGDGLSSTSTFCRR